MELLVAGEMRNGAAKMRADCTGYGESLVSIAKHKDLFVGHKRWRPKGKVGGVADLERLWWLIKHVRYQEPSHGSHAHCDC
jgi:hypothetical protein